MSPKMNKEQKELFNKLSDLQKAVALQRISNPPSVSNTECYRMAKGKAKEASVAASGILGMPKVKDFLNSFKTEQETNAIMSREEMLIRLTNMARTDLDDVIDFEEYKDEKGKKQTVWSIKPSAKIDKSKMGSISEVTAGKEGLKIKIHDQKAAMKQIADLLGFNAPTKQEITGADGGPIKIQEMSDEDLAEELKDLGIDASGD